jgi:hypothetical protein
VASILQPWVEELPIRAQGTLLVAMRSCDVAPKSPPCIDEAYGCTSGESTAERHLVAYLRYLVMVPADEREVGVPGSFFQTNPPTDWKPSQFGHYPLHWYSHLMHAFEVIGFEHFNESHRKAGMNIYHRMVKSLHLTPESWHDYRQRMKEDRIANNSVAT